MNATDYLENLIITQLLRSSSWSKPTALYVALFTTQPNDAGGGTEVTGTSYARVARAPADANWTAPAGGNGQSANAATIDFGTAGSNWGTVGWFAVYDAATGGNMLFWGTFTSSQTISTGNAVTIPANALTVTVG